MTLATYWFGTFFRAIRSRNSILQLFSCIAATPLETFIHFENNRFKKKNTLKKPRLGHNERVAWKRARFMILREMCLNAVKKWAKINYNLANIRFAVHLIESMSIFARNQTTIDCLENEFIGRILKNMCALVPFFAVCFFYSLLFYKNFSSDNFFFYITFRSIV